MAKKNTQNTQNIENTGLEQLLAEAEERREVAEQARLKNQEEHSAKVLAGIEKSVQKKLPEVTDMMPEIRGFLTSIAGELPVLDDGCSVFIGRPDDPIAEKQLGNFRLAVAKNTNPEGRAYVLGIQDLRSEVARRFGNFLKNRIGEIKLVDGILKDVVAATQADVIHVVFVAPNELRNAKGRIFMFGENNTACAMLNDGELKVTCVNWFNGMPKGMQTEVDFYVNRPVDRSAKAEEAAAC